MFLTFKNSARLKTWVSVSVCKTVQSYIYFNFLLSSNMHTSLAVGNSWHRSRVKCSLRKNQKFANYGLSALTGLKTYWRLWFTMDRFRKGIWISSENAQIVLNCIKFLQRLDLLDEFVCHLDSPDKWNLVNVSLGSFIGRKHFLYVCN